jgi:hypothetical protein
MRDRRGTRASLRPQRSRLTSRVESLLTDDNLNVITKDGQIDPDIWAIGDAAIIKTTVLPATAQGRHPCPMRSWVVAYSLTNSPMTSRQSEGQVHGEKAEQNRQKSRAYETI